MKLVCRVMEVSRSGYYHYLKAMPSLKKQKEARLLVEIKALAAESQNSYGKRMMAKHLQAKGYQVGVYAARTLMSKAGIECKQRRRYRVTTDSRHKLPVAENVLNRQFAAPAPNRIWLADMTYLWTLEGWLYIAVVLDSFSRRIVGWAMAAHMQETLVSEALQMALGLRQPPVGLLHHSDRGVQYASAHYQSQLKAQGITVSMSRKGNCWDNSVMERFFGSLKSERTDGKVYITREVAKADVVDYMVMFYNCRRLHSTLGYTSPMQFEQEFLLKNVSNFT